MRHNVCFDAMELHIFKSETNRALQHLGHHATVDLRAIHFIAQMTRLESASDNIRESEIADDTLKGAIFLFEEPAPHRSILKSQLPLKLELFFMKRQCIKRSVNCGVPLLEKLLITHEIIEAACCEGGVDRSEDQSVSTQLDRFLFEVSHRFPAIGRLTTDDRPKIEDRGALVAARRSSILDLQPFLRASSKYPALTAPSSA